MARVRCLGMAVLDIVFDVETLPRSAEKHVAKAARWIGGGGAANAACAIAKLGGEARLCGRLGEDWIAELIEEDLDRRGVDRRSLARFAGGRSCFSSVYLDAAGERQILSYRGEGLGCDPAFLSEDARGYDAALADTRWPEGSRQLMREARARGVPAIVDGEAPPEPEVFAIASHVAYSRQGLLAHVGPHADLRDALRVARRSSDAWLCVTDGANGVHWLDGDRVRTEPGFAIEALDTLGAGDVWHGAFALALAEGSGEIEAVRFANAAGALKCARKGGREVYPSRGEVAALLAA